MRKFLWIFMLMGSSPVALRAESIGDLPAPFRSILGLAPGQITFAEVERKLGKAEWLEADGALQRARYAKSMCYWDANGTRLVVTTDSPDEGTPVDLTELVAPGVRYPPSGRCHPIARGKTIQTAGGLKTGLTLAQVKTFLGKPQQSAPGKYTWTWDAYPRIESSSKQYDYWNGRRSECFEGQAPFSHAQSSITIHFKKGMADRIFLERHESVCGT